MKYLAALVLWIILTTISHAFADEYVFYPDANDQYTSPKDCQDAAINGVELDTRKFVDISLRSDLTNMFRKRYVYGTKIYELFVADQKAGGVVLKCRFLKQTITR